MSRIFIVEDNQDIATLYERLCGQHSTHIYRDAITAINALGSERPDLVILDFHLAGSNGLDVLDNIRASSNLITLPVIGISADDLLKTEAQNKGITAFLLKPLDIDEFLTIMQDHLYPTPVAATPSVELRHFQPGGIDISGQVGGDLTTQHMEKTCHEDFALRTEALSQRPLF